MGGGEGCVCWCRRVDPATTGGFHVHTHTFTHTPLTPAGGGYLTVTRANGAGPTLLLLPAPGTPTSFEAWRPLREDKV